MVPNQQTPILCQLLYLHTHHLLGLMMLCDPCPLPPTSFSTLPEVFHPKLGHPAFSVLGFHICIGHQQFLHDVLVALPGREVKWPPTSAWPESLHELSNTAKEWTHAFPK